MIQLSPTVTVPLDCQFLICLPCPQATFQPGYREKGDGKGMLQVSDRTESQKRALVCSVSHRRIHKALIVVLLLAFLNRRFNRIFQKVKTQYTILYFETAVTRRPFPNLINLILINRNQKGSLLAMSSQNCFFKVL